MVRTGARTSSKSDSMADMHPPSQPETIALWGLDHRIVEKVGDPMRKTIRLINLPVASSILIKKYSLNDALLRVGRSHIRKPYQ
jgi:hypothetical protein